jgi:cyclopropane-fatty-acyl-phospholipid synthase
MAAFATLRLEAERNHPVNDTFNSRSPMREALRRRLSVGGVMKGFLDSLLKSVVRVGSLTVYWPDDRMTRYGDGAAPRASIRLRNDAIVRRIAMDPALVVGEAYMDGDLMLLEGSVYDLVDVFLLNIEHGYSHPVADAWERIGWLTRQYRQFNHRAAARRNVAHHYNLDERLYRLFLDEDMQYSCGYFETIDDTLEQVQRAKKHHIAAKLCLTRPDLTVLDIGCGWGGMALTLARDYGALVTGISLSDSQLKICRERAEAAGLSDRVRFELLDYRDMDRCFDRVVSVGMLEHVGVGNYLAYFAKVRQCLVADGVALIHTIGRSRGPGSTARWLQKYIFPGGYSPALSELVPWFEKSGLVLTDLEVLRMHYAYTIRLWRERFRRNRDLIASIYDERMCRMFEFYLAGAELTFRYQRHVNFQMQFSRDVNVPGLTRDYMMTAPARKSVEMAGD